MNPTIKDVAKKANVSIATVSRILNKQPGYSVKTKERVLEAIKELGYQPNAVARGLINKRTQTIGVLFPDVSSMFSSDLLKGIEDIAHERGHSVIVCHTTLSGQRTMKYLQLLNEKRVDGIIFTSEAMTEEYYNVLKEMNIPVVLLATQSYRYPLPYVKVDDKHAAYSAVSYLIQKGHHNIGMISGDINDQLAGLPRIEGYKQALLDRGIPFDEKKVVVSRGFRYEDGIAQLPKLLKQAKDLTAVFAASDEIAVGALSAAYELGIRVPEDLSIIGYDNLKIAEMAIPPLTTLAQPLYEMGKAGTEMLLDMLETGQAVESRVMPHSIVERRTVKPLS
ncbi:LacI family DNA-binding transcriptional regulator [Bacillus taeanensis]|uniref:LacI family transcriptional regulator n=1 Tax=Bacillus taeanensis TaxID=273032 RepID=A0A366XYJ8_9BACI|nr:substrate-binding domain-containing protein [Bacillus taeanensis]RBW69829.1 LacI family transcriptional regulator [Bacillus taeanensis]